MMLKNPFKLILCILLPGLLFYLAWPPRDLFFLAFIALVPLFFLEQITRGKRGYYAALFSSLFLFNALNTWWIWHASEPGSIAALIINTLLMSLPFMTYRFSIKTFGQKKALMAFIFYWLSFEYLHLNWEVTWPWLSLGNLFAKHNFSVQWYEYTGMLGGSLWVIMVNVFVYKALISKSGLAFVKAIALTVIPILISLYLLRSELKREKPEADAFNLMVLQPNVDPYEKFNPEQEIRTVRMMLDMLEKNIKRETQLVLLPETALVEYMDEDHLQSFETMDLIRDFLKKHPRISIICGASTYNFYETGEKIAPTARRTPEGEVYESYNTALLIDSTGLRQLYHKSKLVPGVEKMPYPKILGFLERFSIDLGGVSGSLGQDDTVTLFQPNNLAQVAPLICYESVFPGFVNTFVNHGAELILVITNDGWWKDTDGYKQHLYYACLRAIENRREVVRSANTGISCHISKEGKILKQSQWWEPAVLHLKAQTENRLTFYSRYGDYIGRLASFLGIFLLLGTMVKYKVRRGT